MMVCITASGWPCETLPIMRLKGLSASFLSRLSCGTCSRRMMRFTSPAAIFPAASSSGDADAAACPPHKD
jgi:hypothetical protein